MSIALLVPVARDFIIDAALQAGRSLWSKAPWARDKDKVSAVEARIRALAADVADLIRNLSEDSWNAGFERLIRQFERDVTSLGLSSVEAETLVDAEREHLRSTVIEPALAARQTRTRIAALESLTEKLEATVAADAARLQELQRLNQVRMVMLAVAVTLSVVASLLSLVALVRR